MYNKKEIIFCGELLLCSNEIEIKLKEISKVCDLMEIKEYRAEQYSGMNILAVFIAVTKKDFTENFIMRYHKKTKTIISIQRTQIGFEQPFERQTITRQNKELTSIIDRMLIHGDEQIKKKIELFWFKDGCPICKSKEIKIIEEDYFGVIVNCQNGCFHLDSSSSEESIDFLIKFFDESPFFSLSLNSSLDEKLETINKIYEKINYWKENDRYLLRMLTNKGE
ncbi:gp453 [Bacillus phage G]|uniref:Gp453 n=1 Tax=Bacillus phage G TaxID=2884420 RepID=G3MAJ4_9CAUD|nr:gp453 [Bacillus phage G]AEO93711.1 gp453 [Bacillus phage G]